MRLLAKVPWTITMPSPLPHSSIRTERLDLVAGDSYPAAHGRGIIATLSDLAFDASAVDTAVLRFKRQDEIHTFEATTVVDSGDDLTVTFEPTSEDTEAMTPGDDWRFNLRLLMNDDKSITPVFDAKARVVPNLME